MFFSASIPENVGQNYLIQVLPIENKRELTDALGFCKIITGNQAGK